MLSQEVLVGVSEAESEDDGAASNEMFWCLSVK
jgi:hypothetical protein